MKKLMAALAVVLLGVVVYGQGRGGPSPEQQAALAKQEALEKSTPRLQITEEVLSLSVPGHTIGEAVGVAKNSQGHLFVYPQRQRGSGEGATASQPSSSPEPEVRQAVGPGQLCRIVRAYGPRRQQDNV